MNRVKKVDKSRPLCYFFCMPKPIRLPNATEQQVLDNLIVRVIGPEETPRAKALICQLHYLKNADLAGDQLCYVAEHEAQWLALIWWSAPALHLKRREQWIGWTHSQKSQRRFLLAQNSRFLILADRLQLPNLATRVLALSCQRLSQDWLSSHGYPIVAVESFVDSQLFRGTAYKAAGWALLGQTNGYGRSAEDFYVRHNRPKQLWVKVLDRRGWQGLKAPQLPEHLAQYVRAAPKRCGVPANKIPALLDRLKEIPDPRKRKGRTLPWLAILGVIVLAKLAGVVGGPSDIAAFAKRLTKPQRRNLNCLRDPETGENRVPSESSYQRALTQVSPLDLEGVLRQWQEELLGPDQDPLVVLDGKVAKNAGKQNIISAISVPSGRVHGVQPVPDKTNEITGARMLIERCPLEGRLVGLDAIHTQHETARQLVQDKGADYLMTLKDNQEALLKTAQTLLSGSFFPSGQEGTRKEHRVHRGAQPSAPGETPTGSQGS